MATEERTPASTREDEFIERVDAQELAEGGDRFMRTLFPRYVEELALGRRVRELFATGRYDEIRIVPHADPTSTHLYDLYGHRAHRAEDER